MIINSDIENVGKEYDYSWRDMAQEIMALREQMESQEQEIREKTKLSEQLQEDLDKAYDH